MFATVLEFDPGEAAQVDFGKGPEVIDPCTGELLSTWVFVMTLAWSRHANAEVSPTRRSPPGSDVTAVRSSGSTACLHA